MVIITKHRTMKILARKNTEFLLIDDDPSITKFLAAWEKRIQCWLLRDGTMSERIFGGAGF